MDNVTIISDGTSQGTKIQIGEEFLSGITRIEIEPITPGGFVRARLTVDVISLKMRIANAYIECTDDAAAEQIRAALLRFGDEASEPPNLNMRGEPSGESLSMDELGG